MGENKYGVPDLDDLVLAPGEVQVAMELLVGVQSPRSVSCAVWPRPDVDRSRYRAGVVSRMLMTNRILPGRGRIGGASIVED